GVYTRSFVGECRVLRGGNFVCGSRGDRAPWPLDDYGFKAVIAPSFGDVFKSNCSKVGILTVELPADKIQKILCLVREQPNTQVIIDLEQRIVKAEDIELNFKIDEFTRQKLLKGLTDIELSLLYKEDIKRYEELRAPFYPKITS